MRAQAEIGWRHVFNGRFCNDWAILQGRHHGEAPNHRIFSMGNRWTTKIIRVIWEEWYGLWTRRNAVVHGTDVASQRDIRKAQLLRRLRDV